MCGGVQVWSHAFSIKACFLDGIIAKQQPFWGILKLIITSRVKDFELKYTFAFSSSSRSSITVLSHLLICSKYGNCLYVTGLSLLLQGHFIYHGYQLIKLLVEKKNNHNSATSHVIQYTYTGKLFGTLLFRYSLSHYPFSKTFLKGLPE